MFIRNAWYVAAWSHEVTRKPMGRIYLGEPVVLYRTRDGAPVALADRCIHRRFPLHGGELIEDRLQCPYHGMEYAPSGECVRIPGGGAAPERLRVRCYPVEERYGWVWIWMGDPALADPAGIEDFHWLDDPQWGVKGTLYHAKCDYRLIIENLLDLTHLAYVHRTTIGNDAVADAARMTTEREDGRVVVTRWMIDTPPPPTYAKVGNFRGNIDRWQIIEYTPPAFIRLYVGGADTGTGAPEGNRVGGIGMRNLNAITPETERTTHYFWAQAHDFEPHNAELTETIFDQIEVAFNEDLAVFEAQQRNIELDPGAPRINLPTDAGGVHALRILDRLLAEEGAETPSETAPTPTPLGG